MDNHYHLFIKTPLANISEGMHYLNTSYANRFRANHKLTGSIFQGRYKSILVDADSYALVLSAYIHLNPLRAGMVEHIDDYPFSSFLDYIGRKNPVVKKLDISLILDKFSNNQEEAKKRYNQFIIENAHLKNPLKESYKNIALGREKFVEKVKGKIKSLGENREIGQTRSVSFYDKEEIIKTVSDCFSVDKDIIFKRQRGNIYRQLTIYLIKRYTALPLNGIGELFDIDYTSVSAAAKRFEKKAKNDKKISGMLGKIRKKIEEKNK